MAPVVCLPLAIFFVASVTHAQTAPSLAVAESLFQEGKDLLQAKQFREACPKLEESQRLDPATGTLIALAVCHQALGKTATAWSEFVAAAEAAATEERADRVAFAKEHADALAPKLSQVKVEIAPATAALHGVDVVRDGAPLRAALWGTWLPLDPGWHTIVVSAPQHRSETLRFLVGEQRDAKVLQVPDLNPVLPLGEPRAERWRALDEGRPRRLAGYVVGAVGIAALGAGSYFGVRAIQHHDQALQRCTPARCTDPEAVHLNDDAKLSANVSNVGIGLGLVGIAVGVALVLTSPSRSAGPAAKATSSLLIGPTNVALRLSL